MNRKQKEKAARSKLLDLIAEGEKLDPHYKPLHKFELRNAQNRYAGYLGRAKRNLGRYDGNN